MKKQILATAVALGVFSTAFAVTAQSGVYLSGNLGWSFPSTYSNTSLSAAYGSPKLKTTQKNSHIGAGAAIGYDYALNQNVLIGGELGYTYFGKTTYNTYVAPINANMELKDRVSGVQALATLTYLDQTGFNVFGKAGAINAYQDWSSHIDAKGYGNKFGAESHHQWLPATVLGVGYMPIQNLNIALQYEHVYGSSKKEIGSNGPSAKPQSQNLISLGVAYKLPI